MTEKSKFHTNGIGLYKPFGEIRKVTNVPNLWRRLEFNEWTFSLLLFIFSLIIVVIKLAANYGKFLPYLNKSVVNFEIFIKVIRLPITVYNNSIHISTFDINSCLSKDETM